jgi:hypothetical protein
VDLLNSIVDVWLRQIRLAQESKKLKWGRTAAQLWGFTGKSYREIYMHDVENQDRFPHQEHGPEFKVRVAKSAEFIRTMLPYVHAKVPNRLVTSRRPDVPPELIEHLGEAAIQMKSAETVGGWLQQWWLNWLASDAGYGLFKESRTAIPEGLVKGNGIVWHEMLQGPYGLIPGSFADTIDGLLIDPDTIMLRDAGYIVRRRVEQVWRVADRFGVDPMKLRGGDRSMQQRAAQEVQEIHEDQHDDRKPQQKGDVVVWYEIFSRIGAGHRLLGSNDRQADHLKKLEAAGQHVYLAVTPGCKFPLNLPPEAFDGTEAELRARLDWPIQYYTDINNPWPMSMLEFNPRHDQPWGSSPMEPGLPYQIFLDHLHSYLFSRVRTTCRDIIVCSSAIEQKLYDAIHSGLDQALVTVDGKPGEELNKLIEILQFPEANTDLWTIGQLAERGFERATGMTPLLGGHEPDKQMRSAEEAARRDQRAGTLPDDFADCVEQWQSSVAAKEAQATRLMVPPPTWLFGEPEPEQTPDGPGPYPGPLSQLWQQHVNTDSPAVACSESSYVVEAGSGRRKNKQQESQDIREITQMMMPSALELAMGGQVQQYNELIRMLDKFYNTIDLDGMQMAPPPPQEGPSPEEQEMMIEQQKAQLDMQIKIQLAELNMQIDAMKAEQKVASQQMQDQAKMIGEVEKTKVQLQIEEIKGVLEMQQKQMELATGVEKAKAELSSDADAHLQDLEQDDEVHIQHMEQDEEKHEQEMVQKEASHKADMKAKKAIAAATPKPQAKKDSK